MRAFSLLQNVSRRGVQPARTLTHLASSHAGYDGVTEAGREGLSVLSAAVLVERLPVVLPKPPEWALNYEKFSFDRSVRNRKEYPSDFLAAAAEPPSDDTKKVLPDGVVDIHTTTDLFTFFDDPSRTTQADVASNTRSLQRALDRRLYLLVKGRPFGKVPSTVPDGWAKDWTEERWRLPEALYAEEDTLRLCAEGAVNTLLTGIPEDLYFVGNAPFAHLEETTGEASTGSKTACKRFLFWAHWVGQEATLSQGKAADFAWFTKEELLKCLQGSEEARLLEDLLLE